MKHTILSKVDNGKLIRNRKQLNDVVASLEGKEISITVEKAKKKRSNPQNAFYYGCVIPIMKQALKDAGHVMTNEAVHDLLKLRFLKETILVDEDSGACIERIKSTTELTTTTFAEYILQIQEFASSYFGVVIPDPNSETTLNFD